MLCFYSCNSTFYYEFPIKHALLRSLLLKEGTPIYTVYKMLLMII